MVGTGGKKEIKKVSKRSDMGYQEIEIALGGKKGGEGAVDCRRKSIFLFIGFFLIIVIFFGFIISHGLIIPFPPRIHNQFNLLYRMKHHGR